MGEILNKKETEEILTALRSQFGHILWDENLVLIRSGKKLWLTNRKSVNLDFKRLNVQVIGLYFGKIEHDGIRLSIDCLQLMDPYVNKNVVELNKKQLFNWVRGFDIDIEVKEPGPYLLLKYKNDIVGCGKRKRDGILNLVPKDRRIKSLRKKMPQLEHITKLK
jgi:NOL1/NOP2/fmu family ribosome biogenesis protein